MNPQLAELKREQEKHDDELLRGLCGKRGMAYDDVVRPNGGAAVCAARRAIASDLREGGWTWARIARAMKRSPWSVRWLHRTPAPDTEERKVLAELVAWLDLVGDANELEAIGDRARAVLAKGGAK